ncbi:type I secretion system permease/ATPase [Aureimonas sp. AU12]|uniref:type I secretion system permease/ATPase n=1 Tax=Aureimonas sp. AU12 TaxID=1638161 RepID=UPI00178C9AE7|nr:type I secretion system permease/ATPase [Aureimonas sp. AU12]
MMVFTFVVNLLLLVQPVYMLQVYDRVLSSGSLDTLLYVSLLAGAALLLLGILDAVRNIIAGRIASRMEVEAGNDTLIAAMLGQRASIGDVQPLRDLQTVRGFVGNRAIFAYLDLPFAPLFIAILWFIHPVLFALTLVGAIVLTILALLNQWASNRVAQEASEHTVTAMLSAQSFVRNAESIRAMGMMENAIDAWGASEARSLAAQDRMNRINSWFSGISKTLRMGLQIAILGVGGYLVLQREMTGGMIFASSLISGRGLQPIDQVIGGWKGFVETRKSWERLQRALAFVADRPKATELPDPVGTLSFHQLVVMPPHNPNGDPLIKKISAYVKAGTCMALIGPSGAGKSTLVRTVVGAVPIRAGSIRVDGADIRNWDPEQLGRRIGYLSQDVELLPGTVAQNIARFDPQASDAEIVEAARKAQVHELIQRLPKGYDTQLGPAGHQLSGGQRQRVGLARAFYGSPRLLVLDEPNAHLDSEGDMALESALLLAKSQQVTVVIVTQRRNVAEFADSIMILRDGMIEDFGSKSEVYGRQAARKKAEDDARQAAAAAAAAARPADGAVVQGKFGATAQIEPQGAIG